METELEIKVEKELTGLIREVVVERYPCMFISACSYQPNPFGNQRERKEYRELCMKNYERCNGYQVRLKEIERLREELNNIIKKEQTEK